MENIITLYNPQWENEKLSKNTTIRTKQLDILIRNLSNRHIIYVTGIRRVGKTTLMKQLVDYLIEKRGVEPQKTLYISLDSYLLAKHNLFEIIEEYRKIHGLSNSEFVYLFLDEITYLKDYEQQLKNLYDFGTCKIYISSSNASLLKSGKPFLTGRNRVIEILPLDFQEYIDFRQIKVKRYDQHLFDKYFHQYLSTGGMPEYVLSGDAAYLTELVNDVILKDIVAVYNIKQKLLLQDFFLLLMERAGKRLSVNKIANILKISTETATRYLNYFSEVYLVYLVSRYGKTNQRIVSAKKVYAPDLGIRTIYTGIRDYGSLFENYVYLKIKHLEPQYIYEQGVEIDFITKQGKLIEAKYHDLPLSKKQETLFDTIKVKQKFIVRSWQDIEQIVG